MSEKLAKSEKARDELYQLVEEGKLTLAKASKLIRIIYQLNQSQYAKKIGVSVETVIKIESGQANPTLETVKKILRPMKLQLIIAKI